MDSNLRDVLITVIQVGGGLVTGFVLARFTMSRSDAMERERWKREDLHRYMRDRLAAYTAFSARTMEAFDSILADVNVAAAALAQGSPLPPIGTGFRGGFFAAYGDVQVLGSPQAFAAAIEVNTAVGVMFLEAGEGDMQSDEWGPVVQAVYDRLAEFSAVAKQDLGLVEPE